MVPVVEALVEELDGADWVLEVGVGTGRFGVPLQQRGVPLVGVDIASRMIARGRRKGLRDVLLADALHLPFRDQAIEASLSVHVLHLLPDWKTALAEIGRVTRDRYLTVASYWESDGPSPHGVYWDAVRAAGYEPSRPRVFERDLPDRLPPRRQREVGTFTLTRDATESVEHLANRVYSGQWELPPGLHEAGMVAVREAFSGKTLTVERRLEVLVWDADDLRAQGRFR